MKFNVGKLYEVKKFFWLLYPTKEAAAGAAAGAGTATATRRAHLCPSSDD